MVCLAVGLAEMKDIDCTFFDEVPTGTIKELFVYSSADQLPHNRLCVNPRRLSNDRYGDRRYVVGFDNEERLQSLVNIFQTAVVEKARFTQYNIWFSAELNKSVANTHKVEWANLKALADIVGIDNLSAPWRQNETTDIVFRLQNSKKSVCISLKTASAATANCFYFLLHKAPNVQFCNVVLAFYKNSDNERTHVSVIPAQRAYAQKLANTSGDKKNYSFNWSHTHSVNADVWNNRLCMNDSDIMLKLTQAIDTAIM